MLTLERCRELLPSNYTPSDAELELLRDQLYGLADVAVSAFIEDHNRRRSTAKASPQPEIQPFDRGQGLGHVQQPTGLQDAAATLSEDDRADVEERAAIMESDGGLDRDAAERAAFSDLWRRQHKPQHD